MLSCGKPIHPGIHSTNERSGDRTIPITKKVVSQVFEEFLNAPDEYKDEIEDYVSIKKIESGKLWLETFTMFEKVIGPMPVPREVTQICEEMWDIARGGRWAGASGCWRYGRYRRELLVLCNAPKHRRR